MAVGEVFTSVLVVLTVFLASRDGALGYPSGAPAAACTTLTPGHLNSGQPISAQAFASPYVIKVQPTKYTPGQPVTVTIESSFSFRGILLQARKNDAPIGTWQAPSGYQLLQCTNPGDSLTHTSMALKAGGAQFTWTPPASATGIIKIMGTIALQKEIFWTGHIAAISSVFGVPTADCASEPCVNGLCFQGSSGGYFCLCDSAFEGTTCSSQKYSPYCKDGRVCGMGGTCFQSSTTLGAYICVCGGMYTGTDCMTEIPTSPPLATTAQLTTQIPSLACESGPCRNGGTCREGAGNLYICDCPADYEGLDCETAVTTPCNPNPCQNSGTCALNGSGFSCTCPTGYTGTRCDEVTTPCNPNPCQNSGTCAPNGSGFSCTCPTGYTGTVCDQTVPPPNPCSPNPCMNGGGCSSSGTTYTCQCLDGFDGANCETQVDCSTSYPCENRGTCNASGQCVCPTGYTGNRCQTAVAMPCDPNPCQNGGSCTDSGNTFSCTCPTGYTGDTCNQMGDTCVEGTTCKNGGSCSASSGQICVCAAGFTGTYCDATETNYCTSNPCKNGGTCISINDRFTCACKNGYLGQTCTTLTNGTGTNTQTGLPLEIWWIALIALIGLLLIIIAIAVCVTVVRSGGSDQAHIIGNRNAKGYP